VEGLGDDSIACSRAVFHFIPLIDSYGRFYGHRVSVAQHKLQNDASGNCNQNIVAACLNPMITTGRGTQVVAAPVIDHVLPVAVFNRKALASAECMVRACATFILSRIVVCVTLVLRAIRLACLVVATILLATALHLIIATTIIAIPIVLGKRKSSRGQRHRHDGGNNGFTFHAGLHWVGCDY
jgi:hypothetical protein